MCEQGFQGSPCCSRTFGSFSSCSYLVFIHCPYQVVPSDVKYCRLFLYTVHSWKSKRYHFYFPRNANKFVNNQVPVSSLILLLIIIKIFLFFFTWLKQPVSLQVSDFVGDTGWYRRLKAFTDVLLRSGPFVWFLWLHLSREASPGGVFEDSRARRP